MKGILAEDCEQMLHDNITGGLERDVMLVVYAPWCPFCKVYPHYASAHPLSSAAVSADYLPLTGSS